MTLQQRCDEYVKMRWEWITPGARVILGLDRNPELCSFQTLMFTVQFYRQHEEEVQRLVDAANKIIHQSEFISNAALVELQSAVEGVGGN